MTHQSACRVYMRTLCSPEEEVQGAGEKKPFKKKRSSRLSRYSEVSKDPVQRGVTFPCSECNLEIDIPGIFPHKKTHAAMTTLDSKWDGRSQIEDVEISIQRKQVITKLMSSFKLTEKHLHSINGAFELLWKKDVPDYYKICDSKYMSFMCTENISTLLIKGVAICADKNSTWKADMNDKATIVNNFGSKPNVCFFSLFDGHKGVAAANLASVELPVLLLHQLSRFDPSYQMTTEEQNVIDSFCTVFKEDYIAIEDVFTQKETYQPKGEYENIHKAFAKAFWRMDRLLRLGRNEVSRVRWSGCSAVTCILEEKIKSSAARRNWRKLMHYRGSSHSSFKKVAQIITGVLHIANTGNVEAVLCRNGKGFFLTKEHTTRNASERRRVLLNGGKISSNEPHGLLEGQTKMTRGLGFHGNPKLKKFIIPAPQTISVPIDTLCQFLILATSGLWEVLDVKEVTALAMAIFQMFKRTYYSMIENKYFPSKNVLPTSTTRPNITDPESNIHLLFQSKPDSKESIVTLYSKELPDKKYSKYFIGNPGNRDSLQPESKNSDALYGRRETGGSTSMTDVIKDSSKRKETYTDRFYRSVAEHISYELVNAAIAAGSRDNITVMVILLGGSEYQFMT